MEVTSRLEEAIKQTQIAKQRAKQPEAAQHLEQGLDSLQSALTAIDDKEKNADPRDKHK